MSTLSADARLTIRNSSVGIAAYVRFWAGDGRWGCPADRCIGYHHEAGEDCGCLPVCIGDVTANPGKSVSSPASATLPPTSLSYPGGEVMSLA